MKAAERMLVWYLRLCGLVTLTALGAVVMPHKWMNLVHGWLGLGELPDLPIVSYLTRSLSALYAFHGALLLLVSRDVPRYLPIIRFLGWAGVALGIILLAIDAASGLPRWWTFVEGPFVVVAYLLVLWLASQIKSPVSSATHETTSQ